MKNKIYNKSIIYTLIGSMLLGDTIPVLAANSIEDIKYTDAIENSTPQTSVYAELGSEFKVIIPKKLTLDGSTKTGIYTVTCEGDIAGYETLKVIPDNSFILSSTNLNDVTATIIQDKTEWSYDEILTDNKIIGNGSINAAGISAGSWNGSFNFNICLDGTITRISVEAKDSEGNDLEASAYDINGSEKEALLNNLIESGMITSTDEVDALIEVNSNQFEGIATTTFDVSSIAKEGEKIAILHFNESTSEWEYISTETVDSNGLITGDFTSYSPVAFVKVNSDGGYDKINNTYDYTNTKAENVFYSTVWSGMSKHDNYLEGWVATKNSGYVGYDFEEPIKIEKVVFRSGITEGYSDTCNYTLYASNDKTDWVELANYSWSGSGYKTIEMENPNNEIAYRYYKINAYHYRTWVACSYITFYKY